MGSFGFLPKAETIKAEDDAITQCSVPGLASHVRAKTRTDIPKSGKKKSDNVKGGKPFDPGIAPPVSPRCT